MKLKEILEKYYMYLTVFITGAVVLVLEILGTRIIAPFYGTTIYAWSSLIGVTLLSLTAGYFLGGLLSDKRPEPNMLYYIISAGAVFILIIPLISPHVMTGTNIFGPKFGALACSALLFSVPLILLGMVSPYAVKINEGRFGKIGTVAGSLYAVATAGSFTGAILTGFYLIPTIGINAIIILSGVLLILVAAAGFMIKGGRNIAAIIPAVAIALLYSMPDIFMARAYGPGMKIVYEKQSAYGRIRVMEWRDLYRFIMIDGAIQSYYDMKAKQFNAAYIRMFEKAADYRPGARNALTIGLGGGSVNQLLQNRGFNIDTVEVDPEVVNAATKYFGFNGRAIVEDGRHYLHDTKKKYDMVFIDAFNGYSVYPYLLSKEALLEAKNALNPNGIVVINMMGYLYRDIDGNMSANRLVLSLNRTLKQVFKNVYLKSENEGLSSFVFYASDSPVAVDKQYIDVKLPDKGIIITDDNNSADFMASDIIEKWRNVNVSQFGADLFI
jgi:spermidine synthase